MPKTRLLAILVILLALCGPLLAVVPPALAVYSVGGPKPAQAEAARLVTSPPSEPSPGGYAPGVLVVKYRSGRRPATLSGLGIQSGVQRAQPLQLADHVRLEVDSTTDLEGLAAALRRDPAVESVERDPLRRPLRAPDDPYYLYQWNFSMVQAPPVWSYTRGAGVTVAVIDSGIAYEDYGIYAQAPDLATTVFVPGYDFVSNSSHPNDASGHGTHVTGTIAQSTDNALGAAGLAPQAKIMPLKACDASGCYCSRVSDAIVWAADQGADVINLSLGGEYYCPAERLAIQHAESKGVVVVAAAGNTGAEGVQYPAAFPEVIAVGAVDYATERASFSTYGAGLDLMAPGVGILQQSFVPPDYQTFTVQAWAGTSMASPHVAGVAALLKARVPGATPAQIREALQMTALDRGAPGRDNYYGFGLVQAYAALRHLDPTVPELPHSAGPGGWTPESRLATPRFYHGASRAGDGRIYVVGGYNGSFLRAADAFRPGDASPWTALPAPFWPTAGIQASAGPNGEVYVHGGVAGFDIATGASKYSEFLWPGASTWNRNIDLPRPRAFAASATGLDRRTYVFGGYDGDYLSTALALDCSGECSWTSLSPLAEPRSGAAALTGADGSIYVLGGANRTGYLSRFDRYDPATDTWTALPPLPTARAFLGTALDHAGRIYAIGGASDQGPLSVVEVYDPSLGAWEPIADLGVARAGLAAATGADGRIYVFGGYTDGGDPAVVEAFTPAAPPPPTATPTAPPGATATPVPSTTPRPTQTPAAIYRVYLPTTIR